MAIAFAAVTTHSRKQGHSSVAAAAYRTRSRLVDERTGETFDYRRRAAELEHTGLYVPQAGRGWLAQRHGQSAQDIRAALWNAVEAQERRGDARIGRDLVVASPWELSPAQRRRLNYEIARMIGERHGVAVEYSAHLPHRHAGDERAEARNYHVHLHISPRKLEATGFTAKARELDNPKESGAHIEAWRAGIAELMNKALARAGYGARIDMRSYERQGVAREGQTHEGPQATALKRRTGMQTEVGAHNAAIQAANVEREEAGQRTRLNDKSNVIDFEAKRQQRDTRRMQAELFRRSVENTGRMRKALEGQRRTEERLRAERLRNEAAEAERHEAALREEQARLVEEAAQREQERLAERQRRVEEAVQLVRAARHTALDQKTAPDRATPARREGPGLWGWMAERWQGVRERLGQLLFSLPAKAGITPGGTAAASPAVPSRQAVETPPGQALPPRAEARAREGRTAEVRQAPERPGEERGRRERASRARGAAFEQAASSPARRPQDAEGLREHFTRHSGRDGPRPPGESRDMLPPSGAPSPAATDDQAERIRANLAKLERLTGAAPPLPVGEMPIPEGTSAEEAAQLRENFARLSRIDGRVPSAPEEPTRREGERERDPAVAANLAKLDAMTRSAPGAGRGPRMRP